MSAFGGVAERTNWVATKPRCRASLCQSAARLRPGTPVIKRSRRSERAPNQYYDI
jgi:hypothetical protein